VDFVDHLETALSGAQVVLVIIGPNWLQPDASGERRIDHFNDYVRLEIRSALERKIPIIPVLVGHAHMPTRTELPPDLSPLATLNAADIRGGPGFNEQVQRLIQGILAVMPERQRSATLLPAGPSPEPIDMSARGGDVHPGQVVARHWKVVDVLGLGNTGGVYEVQHQLTDVHAALTVLHLEEANNPRRVRRYLEMAKVTSKLRHPNIVSMLDAGQLSDGRVYLILELLSGPTVADILQAEGGFDLSRLRPLASQLCSALDVGHQQGIFHRDLKPKWIHIERGLTGNECLKLRRLGVSEIKIKDAVDESRQQVTAADTGRVTIIGTAGYISPEFIKGQSPEIASPKADIYSAAVVIYQMITGRLPHDGESDWLLMAAQVNQPPKPIGSIPNAPAVPAALEDVLRRAMSTNPEERPATILAFRDELAAVWPSPGATFETRRETLKIETPDPAAAGQALPLTSSGEIPTNRASNVSADRKVARLTWGHSVLMALVGIVVYFLLSK